MFKFNVQSNVFIQFFEQKYSSVVENMQIRVLDIFLNKNAQIGKGQKYNVHSSLLTCTFNLDQL